LEHAPLEELLNDVLLEAGERLAEALRAGLAEQGLPDELHVRLDAGRVVVASRSHRVREAELGKAGVPPTALMEGIAQESAPLLVALLENRLKGFRV
jgi:hypothetical protein